MAILHVVFFAVAACAVAVAVARGRAEPVLALSLGGAGFGIACGLSVGQLGKSFGIGFGQAAAGPGLAVLAASFVGALAERGGATRFVAGWAARQPAVVARGMPVAGVLAGLGAVPASAFAIMRPVAEAAGADRVRLALAIAAGQGLLLPSPVMVAATTIVGADWRIVLALGLPCVAAILVATGFARGRHTEIFPPADGETPRALPAAGLLVATVVMLGLLIVQSVGDIASEPFGGGSARELLLGLGRPYILLLGGFAIMAATTLRTPKPGVAALAINRAAPLILVLGAAGGLQSLAIDSRMADGLAETLAAWHGGLFVPFLVAACLKMLVGASPVAAISAAGLMQPALAGLGLTDPVGLACTALAIGAGATAGSHVNDPFFWLVTGGRQDRMAWFFGGTLAQGVAVVGALFAVHAVG